MGNANLLNLAAKSERRKWSRGRCGRRRAARGMHTGGWATGDGRCAQPCALCAYTHFTFLLLYTIKYYFKNLKKLNKRTFLFMCVSRHLEIKLMVNVKKQVMNKKRINYNFTGRRTGSQRPKIKISSQVGGNFNWNWQWSVYRNLTIYVIC